MRKKIAVWIMLNFILATLIALSPIGLAEASIHSWSWVGPQYNDPVFGTVTAFTEGSYAMLLVTVRNNYANKQLNVSAVKVLLDWNINYSSTEANETNPLVIQPSIYYTFTINFSVPSTSIASNLFKHYYWIYVEEVNATTGPKSVTLHDEDNGSNFIVYSTDQADAQTLRQEIDRIFAIYPTTGSLSSNQAKIIWNDATAKKNAGEESYIARDFASAKTHYQTALSLLNTMITTEETYLTSLQENELKKEEASIKSTESMASYYNSLGNASIIEANAAVKQAEAAMIEANATLRTADAAWVQAEAAKLQAYSWNLFGIGFILFGVAAIVYASKKPKPPP